MLALFFVFFCTKNQHKRTEESCIWIFYIIAKSRAKRRRRKGGILSLKNYLFHAHQEGQGIRVLKGTLIFQQGTDLVNHWDQMSLNTRVELFSSARFLDIVICVKVRGLWNANATLLFTNDTWGWACFLPETYVIRKWVTLNTMWPQSNNICSLGGNFPYSWTICSRGALKINPPPHLDTGTLWPALFDSVTIWPKNVFILWHSDPTQVVLPDHPKLLSWTPRKSGSKRWLWWLDPWAGTTENLAILCSTWGRWDSAEHHTPMELIKNDTVPPDRTLPMHGSAEHVP